MGGRRLGGTSLWNPQRGEKGGEKAAADVLVQHWRQTVGWSLGDGEAEESLPKVTYFNCAHGYKNRYMEINYTLSRQVCAYIFINIFKHYKPEKLCILLVMSNQ